MNISGFSLDRIDPKLFRLFRSSDTFITIGNAMILAGINIEELEGQLKEGMIRGRLLSSIEMEARQLFLDELREPVLHIFESLERLREDIQVTDWDDRDGASGLEGLV